MIVYIVYNEIGTVITVCSQFRLQGKWNHLLNDLQLFLLCLNEWQMKVFFFRSPRCDRKQEKQKILRFRNDQQFAASLRWPDVHFYDLQCVFFPVTCIPVRHQSSTAISPVIPYLYSTMDSSR